LQIADRVHYNAELPYVHIAARGTTAHSEEYGVHTRTVATYLEDLKRGQDHMGAQVAWPSDYLSAE
jgi:hypothetical protein